MLKHAVQNMFSRFLHENRSTVEHSWTFYVVHLVTLINRMIIISSSTLEPLCCSFASLSRVPKSPKMRVCLLKRNWSSQPLERSHFRVLGIFARNPFWQILHWELLRVSEFATCWIAGCDGWARVEYLQIKRGKSVLTESCCLRVTPFNVSEAGGSWDRSFACAWIFGADSWEFLNSWLREFAPFDFSHAVIYTLLEPKI